MIEKDDIETISDLLKELEELIEDFLDMGVFSEDLKALLRKNDDKKEDDENTEIGEDQTGDEEVKEDENYDMGSITEYMEKYQKMFKKYMEVIKNELETHLDNKQEIHVSSDKKTDYKETQKRDLKLKSPFERGHKWGCGCPGCSSFRETFGGFSAAFSKYALEKKSLDEAFYDKSAWVNKNSDDHSKYPCGGKLRGVYRYQLEPIFGDKKHNSPKVMNYIAL